MTGLRKVAKAVVGGVLTATMGDRDSLVTLATQTGPAAGLRFQLDLQGRLEYAYWSGTYDREILEKIAALAKPGWTAWDCGTYLGYYTCFLARLVGPTGKVCAFEPDPTNFARTQRAVALNGLTNVSLIQAAIGESSGEIDLLVNAGTNSHLPGVYVGADRESYARKEKHETVIKVRCLSLDDAYFAEGAARPDIIKIDIEGAEMLALPQTRRLCREVRPLFVLELHNPECDRAAWDWSQEQGYSLQSIATGRTLTRAEDVGGTLLCSPR